MQVQISTEGLSVKKFMKDLKRTIRRGIRHKNLHYVIIDSESYLDDNAITNIVEVTRRFRKRSKSKYIRIAIDYLRGRMHIFIDFTDNIRQSESGIDFYVL